MTKNLPFTPFDLNDKGGQLTIRIAASTLPLETVEAIKKGLLDLNPDVAQMIASGLVGDIAIQQAEARAISSTMSKRRY